MVQPVIAVFAAATTHKVRRILATRPPIPDEGLTMKRIAICCDGTWNRLDAENVTNVVRAAESIQSHADDGTPQVIYYDEGVGSGEAVASRIDRWLGGAFGAGLMHKVEQAYRFLVFNYEPGDEIYIFGFSRGAFTARSLAGLIRNCGIVEQPQARRLREALDLYRRREANAHPDAEESCRFRSEVSPRVVINDREKEWRTDNVAGFDASSCQPLRIRYLGVWDTVGALGVPNHFKVSGFFNKKYQFHDTNLSSMVESARHAVAIDEERRAYEPSLWSNLDVLNQAAQADRRGEGSAYGQVWFPGDHSSVGGGGDVTDHASAALLWIAEGAQSAGLTFRPAALKAIREEIDHRGSLASSTKSGFNLIRWLMSKRPRSGPALREELSDSALRRLEEAAENLLEKAPYRPEPLSRFFPS